MWERVEEEAKHLTNMTITELLIVRPEVGMGKSQMYYLMRNAHDKGANPVFWMMHEDEFGDIFDEPGLVRAINEKLKALGAAKVTVAMEVW